MQAIKTKNELDILLKSNKIIVIKFSSEWCQPCLKLVPIYTEVSQLEQFKNVSFVKVDIDDASDLASDYGVMTIPTLIVIKDGKMVASQTGYVAKPALTAWITKNIK